MIEIKDDLIVPFHFCFVSRRMGFISEAQGFGGPMSCHFIFVHFSGNLCCRWNASLSFCTFFRTEIFVEIRVDILTTPFHSRELC